ncbi:MAG: hypothetical protein ACF8R7_06840 [Phycisphaerales bacterium JB039]
MTAESGLARLLEAISAGACQPALPEAPFDGLIGELVFAMLVWEAGHQRASRAARRIAGEVVDVNELRVCLPADIKAMIGARYPQGLERGRRLRAALEEIYQRENAVTLEPLTRMPADQAHQRLLQTAGVPPFAAARVTLLRFGGPAFPVDARLVRSLRSAGALPAEVRGDDACCWLQQRIACDDMLDTYLRLEAWADSRRRGAGS